MNYPVIYDVWATYYNTQLITTILPTRWWCDPATSVKKGHSKGEIPHTAALRVHLIIKHLEIHNFHLYLQKRTTTFNKDQRLFRTSKSKQKARI